MVFGGLVVVVGCFLLLEVSVEVAGGVFVGEGS
jgi:hypothetical protein